MSIKKIAQIKNPHSEEYLQLICAIYLQFDNLSEKMKQYQLTESLFYIQLARRCFKEAVENDINLS